MRNDVHEPHPVRQHALRCTPTPQVTHSQPQSSDLNQICIEGSISQEPSEGLPQRAKISIAMRPNVILPFVLCCLQLDSLCSSATPMSGSTDSECSDPTGSQG